MAVCLIKLLVYGEPIVDQSHLKTEHMKNIVQSIENKFHSGDLSMAKIGYLRQLQCYGINIPSATNISWLECITFTCWQITRTIIHRLPFGLWLSRKIGGLYCSDDIRTRAMQTYKEIAWILHRLNQIDLMEIQKMSDASAIKWRDRIHCLMVTLYAVNMIEAAEPTTNTREIVDIYLNAMLRMKSSNSRLFAAYYLRKAKFYHLLGTTQPTSFDWMFTEHGYRFVSQLKLNGSKNDINDDQLDDCCGNIEPTLYVHMKYRRYLLTMAMEKLLGFHRNAESNPTDDANYKNKQTQTSAILKLTMHLFETMNNESNETDTFLWIARIISATVYWRSNDLDTNCPQLYKDIDAFMHAISGKHMKKAKPLIKSLYMAFIAKREFVHCTQQGQFVPKEKLQLILNHCNIASCLLQNYLTNNRSQNVVSSTLIYLIEMLVCDWLLELRSDCWDCMQNESNEMVNIDQSNAFRITSLEFYQMDLTSLYMVFDTKPLIQSRIGLYEAIYRLMAGATPLETYSLLWRNIQPLRQIKPNLICVASSKASADAYFTHGEREQARSMLLACKYLRSQVDIERQGLLTQAGTIFKNIGDMNKAKECYHLLNECHEKNI